MRNQTGKLRNEYDNRLGALYKKTPKAVLAAIVVAFIDRIEGNAGSDNEVRAALLKEWATLHANGIIPQHPSCKKTGTGIAAGIRHSCACEEKKLCVMGCVIGKDGDCGCDTHNRNEIAAMNGGYESKGSLNE